MKKKKLLNRVVSLSLVVLTLFAMIPHISITADAAGQTTITLKQGTLYDYADDWGWSTHELTADDKMVYCINPDLPLPDNGEYRTDKGNLVEIKSTDNKYKMYLKALYYGYGGNGFTTSDTAFKTDTTKHLNTYTNTTPHHFMANLRKTQYGQVILVPTSNELYYLLTHHVLSYINLGDAKYKSTIVGEVLPPYWYSAIVELYDAISKAPMPTTTQKIYKLNVGSKYQNILIIKQGIKLHLQKSSANSNLSYSLKGAKYNIYLDKACTDYYGYIVTNESGFGKYGAGTYGVDVPIQTYYCKEVEAPTGYQLNSTVYEFKKTSQTIDGSVVYKANVTDVPYIKLQLQKSSANPDITDGNDCYSLAGAEYTIYSDQACTKQFGTPIVTDEDGYACYGSSGATNTDIKDKDTSAYKKISGRKVAISSGTFYCKETKAPKGYELDDTVYKFVDSGSVSSYGVKIYRAVSLEDGTSKPTDEPINDPVGIVLQKRNAVTGETVNQGLEGAIFQVQYYATEIDKDYDVASGETAPTLDTSTLKRTWYIKTDNDGYCELNANYLVDNDIYSSDEFYYTEDNPIPCIPVGTIVIFEKEAPSGYFKSNTVFYRRINEEIAGITQDTNTPITVPIDEQPAKGYIGINKMNNSRKGVAGAEYGLYSDSTATALLSTLVTDTGGKGVFDFKADINKTYYIKEIKAPTGYSLDSTVYPITPTEENTTVDTAIIQDIYEESVKGSILIKKSSNNGVVSNLWFAVTDNLGNEYNAVSTDENGEATVTGLPIYDENGTAIKYTVKELGFKTELGTHSYGSYSWTITADNCIKYKGAYYEGVANNAFNGCDYSYSRYYYGDSTSAVKNANGDTKTLIDNSTVTYSFVNTVPTTDVEVYKDSYDGIKEDLYFQVQDQFGKVYGVIKTDNNGYASFSEQNSITLYSCIQVPNSSVSIPLKYQVVELGKRNPGNATYYLPETYSKAYVSELVEPNIAESSSTITFSAYNYADTGKINIDKTSDDGDISNICFKISAYEDLSEYGEGIYDTSMGWDANGNPITSIVVQTDESGYVSTADYEFYDINGELMDGLPVYIIGSTDWEITYEIEELGYDNGDGTYTLPNRYIPNEPVKFNLLDNRSYTYSCHNSIISPAQLQILKTSEDNIVEDIWFNVRADSIDYNINISTDENGYTTVLEGLPIYQYNTQSENVLVEYTITELGTNKGDSTFEMPYRYKSQKSVTVTLDSTDEVKLVSFNNVLKTGSVTLYKQNYKGEALSGSQWGVYNSDGTQVKFVQTGNGSYMPSSSGTATTLSTDSSGKLYLYNCNQGEYYFVEVKSPNGTSTYGKKINFTISGDSAETLFTELTVKDSKIVLYDTGGNGRFNIQIVGYALLALVVAIFTAYTITVKKSTAK